MGLFLVRLGARWCAARGILESFWGDTGARRPCHAKREGGPGARRLIRTGWKVRVTGEDLGTRRAVIYTYRARCAPGWCRRAARGAEVRKCSGKLRKIIFQIGILCFGALRARALLARSA